MGEFTGSNEMSPILLAAPVQSKMDHLWYLIGNTPMIEISYRYKKVIRKMFVKCEHYNLTGSIKDRMALYILQKAYEHNLIKPGDCIVEATSGNTGISFSAIGRALGHDVKIIMPNWLSRERIRIMESLGAEVILISEEDGGFLWSITLSQAMAERDKTIFLPRQFENLYNVEAHEKTTAREIWMQLQSIDLQPDAFVAGVGTGGTLMGVAKYMKRREASISVHPVEPLESPTLSSGQKKGTHRIQGISDEFIPKICQLQMLDRIIQVSDGDAILAAQQLAGRLGLGVGISSGANFLGAVQVSEQLGGDAVVTTVFCDSNKKYFSSHLFEREPVKDNYLTPAIELLGYRAIKCL